MLDFGSEIMSETNIRIANMEDAEELHQLMYDAFTPLRELGMIGLQSMQI